MRAEQPGKMNISGCLARLIVLHTGYMGTMLTIANHASHQALSIRYTPFQNMASARRKSFTL